MIGGGRARNLREAATLSSAEDAASSFRRGTCIKPASTASWRHSLPPVAVVAMLVFVVFAVLLGVADIAHAASKLPSYIKTCHRNDPKVEDCILNSIDSLRPMLVKGIPELHVPPLDPLYLGEYHVNIGGQTSFNAVGRDVVVHGASDFTISHLRVDLKNHFFRVHMDVPWMLVEGTFDVDGRFIMLPIRGTGPIRCNATNIRGELELRSELVTHDGIEHLTFKSVEVDLKIGALKVTISFNNDPILSEAANGVLAGNQQLFVVALLPALENTLGKVMLDTANKITRNYSYEEIFPQT